MAKEFAVPPVIFSSAENLAGGNVQQRRAATAPFQTPPRSSTSSSIPFLSFDIGSASANSAAPFSRTIASNSSSFSVGSATFEDEPPLLDELGIHPDQIWQKTKSILNPFRVNLTVHNDSDLSGPFFLYLGFGIFQLLAGKIQFGIILGWIVVASIFLYVVFNMLAGRNGNLDLHTCTSLVGYCLLPVVILSAVSLFMPQGNGPARLLPATVFVAWAAKACSNLVIARGDEHRGLIFYACFLIYTVFSFLVIF